MKKWISGAMVSAMILTSITAAYADLQLEDKTVVEAAVEVVDTEIFQEAEGDKKNLLTYEEALQKALEQNHDYKKLEKSIEQTEEIQKNLGDLHRFTPIPHDQNADAGAINLLLNRKKVEIQNAMAKKQRETIEDMISYKVRTEYDEIVKRIKEIQLQKKMVEHAEKQLTMLSTKEMVGFGSEYDYQVQRNKFLEEQQKMQTLEKALNEAYSKLNATMGIKESERYAVEMKTELQPMEERDIEKYAKTIIGRHPDVWNQQQQVRMKELEVELYVFYNPGHPLYNPADPYEVREIEVKKSQIELSSLKEDIKASIYSLDHKIKQLESQYKTLEVMLQKAEKDARMARLMYDVGMGIELDAEKAELALLHIQNQMETLALTHQQLKILFEKPWIMPR